MGQVHVLKRPSRRDMDRAHPRYRTFIAAHALVEGAAPILCVVRDMSRSGAKLVLRDGEDVPAIFRLHLLSRDQYFTARRIWRRGELVGVEIEGE